MTNQKYEQLEEQYNNFIELVKNNYPLDKMSLVMDPDIMGYGANLDEKIFNLDELYESWRIQKEQSVGLDILFEITPIYRRISHGENVAIYVDEISLKVTVDGVKHENELRLSIIFEFLEERWICTHFHGSYGLAVTGDSWAIELMKEKNEELQRMVDERTIQLQNTIHELKSTQAQLIQSEKMASLGELTAGIAHEIQNPLNFVNNFSEVSNELMDEMAEEMAKGDLEEATAIAADIKQNLEKITHHGKRADAIVKGMLAHSRADKGEKAPTDLNALAEEYLKLSYHGLRAKDKSFNADFKTDFDPDLPKMNVVPQDIGRVLLNLINNAFQACAERSRSACAERLAMSEVESSRSACATEGIEKPLVTVKTARKVAPSHASDEGRMTERNARGVPGILISVSDNGPGIPDSIKDKIFQPFFTTKPTGQGTGLGLSLSYDIVKAHGGEIKISNNEDGGAEFCIILPINA